MCIDLFCGLGGWTEGFLSEGWNVVGFDITRHVYGADRYPAQLVLQDVLTIHGSQFRNADIIVASPPCQQYSWLAMPWSRSKDPNNSKAAKALRAKWESEGPDNRLFDACFRIQREAIYAKRLELRCCELDYSKPGCPRCHIPLIVENVRGAQPWVGRSAWNYGSFHLWGDVPALMPKEAHRKVKGVQSWSDFGKPGYKATAFNGQAVREMRAEGEKTVGHVNKRDGHSHTRHLTNQAEHDAVNRKHGNGPGSWFARGEDGKTKQDRFREKPVNADEEGTKIGGDWFRDPACHSAHASRSNARKAASAMIAKIPLPLSTWIARVYKP